MKYIDVDFDFDFDFVFQATFLHVFDHGEATKHDEITNELILESWFGINQFGINTFFIPI